VPEVLEVVENMATKNLALELDLKSGVPLYIQIKQQIGKPNFC